MTIGQIRENMFIWDPLASRRTHLATIWRKKSNQGMIQKKDILRVSAVAYRTICLQCNWIMKYPFTNSVWDVFHVSNFRYVVLLASRDLNEYYFKHFMYFLYSLQRNPATMLDKWCRCTFFPFLHYGTRSMEGLLLLILFFNDKVTPYTGATWR